MTILSRFIGWLLKLPPAETRDVAIERDIKVPMPDGIALLADHYSPRGKGKRPTILIRVPYGRASGFGALVGLPFAERGFQVLIQSCRGTFGSGGVFNAFRDERVDGLATFAWLKQQTWFSGEVATFGLSYLAFTQWAIAAEAGPELKALAVQVGSSELRSLVYPGGSFWLDTALTWIYLLEQLEKSPLGQMIAQARMPRVLRPAYKELPLRATDEAAIGKPSPYYREWLEHNKPGDPWWQEVDFSGRVPEVTAPVHLLGGWYDVFLPSMVADYTSLRKAGRDPHLTIGPWAHTSKGVIPVAMRESITWFRAHLLKDRGGLREAPVRVFVMGAEEWREFPEWPPVGYQAERWHLQPGGGLSTKVPAESAPDHYRYEPADPTPSVGGTSLSQNSGPMDNRALEARADVLVYTSAPLDRDVEAIGPVTAELYAKSSLEHTDFFVRLCDVHPSGKSINICDGVRRLEPGGPSSNTDGCNPITLELWPTAHRFKRGHRIRVQVSSGAHPRFARNLGSGEPLATGTTLTPADQSVFHDPAHPSAVILPIRE
jgi:putative CocE/NonD family hydrolase